MSEPRSQASIQHKTAFDMVFTSLGHVWSTALGSGAGLVTRGLVATEAFGAYAAVDGCSRYLSIGNSVFRNAISKGVPEHLARGEREASDDILQAAYTTLFISIAIQAAALVTLAMTLASGLLRFAFLTGAFLNATESINATDHTFLRSTHRFRTIAVAHLVTGVVSAGSLLLSSWLFGAEGFFLGLATASSSRLILVRILMRRWPLAYVTWKLRRKIIWRMARTGLGIALVGLAITTLLTVDRWVILRSLGAEALGHYSLGTSIMLSASLIPASIVGTYFPALVGLVARNQGAQAAHTASQIQALLTLTAALLFGFLALIGEPAIRIFLPTYQPAVPTYEVTMLLGYLYSGGMLASSILIAYAKTSRNAVVHAASASLTVVLALFLVRYGTVGVAVASAAGVGACYFVLTWLAQKSLARQDLLACYLGGFLLLMGFYLCLWTVGRAVAGGYLAAVTIGVVWYLTKRLELDWQTLPASARLYLHGRTLAAPPHDRSRNSHPTA